MLCMLEVKGSRPRVFIGSSAGTRFRRFSCAQGSQTAGLSLLRRSEYLYLERCAALTIGAAQMLT